MACVLKVQSQEFVVRPPRLELTLQDGTYWVAGGICDSHSYALSSGCSVCLDTHCQECSACCGSEVDTTTLGSRLFTSAQKVKFLLQVSPARPENHEVFSQLDEDMQTMAPVNDFRALTVLKAKINSTYCTLQALEPALAYISFDTAVELLVSGQPYPLQPMTASCLHWFEWGRSQLHITNLATKVSFCLNLKCLVVPFYSRSVALEDGSLLLTGGRHEASDIGISDVSLVSYQNGEVTVTAMPPMEFGRSNHALVCLLNSVYAIGGCDEANIFFDQVERFDLSTQQWEECASTPEVRDSINAASDEVNNCIYIAGGRVDNGIILDSIAKYDATDDFWTVLPLTLTIQVDTCGIALLPGGSQLLVFGGLNDQHESTNLVHLVDLLRQRVDRLEDMKGTGGCMVNQPKIYGNHLYVMPFFGYETRSFERMDLTTEEWEILE
jgi:hypothetical protein